jgi:hypothetical protein
MNDIRTRIERLLELPALIGQQSSRLVAFRAEKRKAERKLESLTASIRIATLGNASYTVLKNAADRDAFMTVAQNESEMYTKTRDRLDELATAIDKANAEIGTLEHERKALKAALEREYALIIEKALSDEILTRALAAHGKAQA